MRCTGTAAPSPPFGQPRPRPSSRGSAQGPGALLDCHTPADVAGKGADVDGRYACTGSPVDTACCGGWAVETACGSWGAAHAMTASSSTPVPAPHDSCPPPWSSPSSQRVKAPSESNGSLASQTPIAPHAAACLLLDDSTLALTPRCETLNPKPSLNPRPYSPYPQASTLRPLGLTLGCQWNTSVHICSSDVLLLLYATAAVYAHVCVCVHRYVLLLYATAAVHACCLPHGANAAPRPARVASRERCWHPASRGPSAGVYI